MILSQEVLGTIYSLCPTKDSKQIIADYKKIYTSSNIEEANFHLDVFRSKYGTNQRKIVKKAIADIEEVCKAKVVSGSVKEEINTYEMSEETFIANAAIVLDDEQCELELD